MKQSDILAVAYARYEGRGCVPGHDLADWLEAESQLKAEPDVRAAAQSVRLTAFIQEFLASRFLLQSRFNIDTTYNEIQEALQDICRVEREVDLSYKQLSAERIAEIVAAYPLGGLRTTVVESLNISDIPLPEGACSLFTEEIKKLKGDVWEIHKGDQDTFPFPVHGHLEGTALKIDFRDGQIYKKRTSLAQMRKKDLLELRSRFKTPLPALTIE